MGNNKIWSKLKKATSVQPAKIPQVDNKLVQTEDYDFLPGVEANKLREENDQLQSKLAETERKFQKLNEENKLLQQQIEEKEAHYNQQIDDLTQERRDTQ